MTEEQKLVLGAVAVLAAAGITVKQHLRVRRNIKRLDERVALLSQLNTACKQNKPLDQIFEHIDFLAIVNHLK